MNAPVLVPPGVGRDVLLAMTRVSSQQRGQVPTARAVPNTDYFSGHRDCLGSARLLPALPLAVWDTPLVATSMALLWVRSLSPTQRPE